MHVMTRDVLAVQQGEERRVCQGRCIGSHLLSERQ